MSKNIFMFDVESDGLYGHGFAVGTVVATPDGEIIDTFEMKSNVSITDNWVKENVLPHLGDMPSCETSKELRTKFYDFYMKYKNSCIVYSDCNFPVETNFLTEVVRDDEDNRKWEMPFPLMDVATVKNINVSRNYFYKVNTGKKIRQHNPLDDAIASLYFLLHYYNK